MKGSNEPKIPIPGAAGAATFVCLQALVMHAGGGEVKVEKVPSKSGGYTYNVTRTMRGEQPLPNT